MARPSQNIDKKLIKLGKKKLMEHGISNISIRSICMESGINLGMFHYYFKSKENFIKELFRSLSEELVASLLAEAAKLSTSEEKLKKILYMSARMMKEKRGLVETIMKDTNIFDKIYREIGKDFHDKWFNVYSVLIEECKKDGYIDKNIETDMIIPVLTGAVHFYAHNCEYSEYGDEKYYENVYKMIDFVIEKIK